MFVKNHRFNMKKLITFFAVALMVTASISAFSQEPNKLPLLSGTDAAHAAGLDTVVNTGSKTQSGKINGYNSIVSIQTFATRLAGSSAAGVARLYGSLDNVNWDRLQKTDSLLLVNAAGVQTKIWSISPSSCTYYKVVVTGGATGTVQISNTAIWRKPKEPK